MLTGNKVKFLDFKDIEECKCDICGKITNECETFGSCMVEVESKINNTKCYVKVLLTEDILDNVMPENFHICNDCISSYIIGIK